MFLIITFFSKKPCTFGTTEHFGKQGFAVRSQKTSATTSQACQDAKLGCCIPQRAEENEHADHELAKLCEMLQELLCAMQNQRAFHAREV